MIAVKRPAVAPPSLGSAAAAAQSVAAAAYYGTWVPGMNAYSPFGHYKGQDVIAALHLMCHGKCAYCEQKIEKGSREVEHYRPKGGVEDPTHPGYWWLATSWTNLLPTCGPCNKGLRQHVVTLDMTVADVAKLQATPPARLMGKKNSFPVGAARLTASSEDHEAEQPLLIDPCRSDPDRYLRWSHASDFSILVPRELDGQPSIQGEETIRCLALNRSGLVEARTTQLNILRTQRTRILADLEDTLTKPEAEQEGYIALILRSLNDMRLHCGPEVPFAAMATAYYIALRLEIKGWLADHAPAILLSMDTEATAA